MGGAYLGLNKGTLINADQGLQYCPFCPHWWFFVSGENLRKLKFHLTWGLVFKHTCTIGCHSSHRLTKRDGRTDGCILYRYTVYTLNQVSLERRYFHSNWWQRRKTERLHWGSRGRFLQHLGMQLLIATLIDMILMMLLGTRTWQPVKKFAPRLRLNSPRRKWSTCCCTSLFSFTICFPISFSI